LNEKTQNTKKKNQRKTMLEVLLWIVGGAIAIVLVLFLLYVIYEIFCIFHF